jgi:hypothetical protein
MLLSKILAHGYFIYLLVVLEPYFFPLENPSSRELADHRLHSLDHIARQILLKARARNGNLGVTTPFIRASG